MYGGIWDPCCDGVGQGGYFIRVDPVHFLKDGISWDYVKNIPELKKFFKKLEEKGHIPVAVISDGSWTVEVIIQK